MTFSLRAVFVAVSFCGFGCFALANASVWWLSVIVTLGILGLGACLVESLASAGQKRAVMIGCLATAVTYLTLVFCPWPAMNVRPYLLTTQLANFVAPERRDAALVYIRHNASGSDVTETRAGEPFFYTEISMFEATAHWLCAFIAAVIGGVLGRYVDQHKRSRARETT